MVRRATLRNVLGLAARAAGLLLAGLMVAQGRGQTVISGTYDGVTISGDISIAANTFATFTGGSTFIGANATLGLSSRFIWQQTGTLSGKTITQANGATISVNGGLTLDKTTTLTGHAELFSNENNGTVTNHGTISHNLGHGYLYASTFTNTGTITATGGVLTIGDSRNTTVNSGTIVADGAGVEMTNFTNTGTLRAQNSGFLSLGGITTARLGTVEVASGGRVGLGMLDNTGATLNAPLGGVFELGGTITNGMVASGALTFSNSGGGTLDNVLLMGSVDLPSNTSVIFRGGSTFTGSTVNLGFYSQLSWYQSTTIDDKTLTFAPESKLLVGNNTLTLGPKTTATGSVIIVPAAFFVNSTLVNQGTITHTGDGGGIAVNTFSNTGNITAANSVFGIGSQTYAHSSTNATGGTITADGAGAQVYLFSNFVNQGTLVAKNSGQLIFSTGYSPQTTANLGAIQIATGGHVYLAGTLDNTGATLAAPSGGSFELYHGTINNGSVAAGALAFTSNGGKLNNVTLEGNFIMPDSAHVFLLGGSSFTGPAATLGAYSQTDWQQGGALENKTLAFGTSAYVKIIESNSLTLGSGTVATGNVRIHDEGFGNSTLINRGTITNTSGDGYLSALTFTNTGNITASGGTLTIGGSPAREHTSTHSGTLISDGSGTEVRITGHFANTGTIRAQNSGAIYFQGTNSSANLGTVQIDAGSHVYLAGFLTNTAATLNAPASGIYEMLGGTIYGGIIAPSALIFTGSGGALNNASLSGDLVLPENASVSLQGGSVFTGANANLGKNTRLLWQQLGTLGGKSLSFGTGSSILIGSEYQLTLGADTTATGAVRITSGSGSGPILINEGTINHTTGAGLLKVSSFSNSGAITASNGSTLDIGNFETPTSTNARGGTIVADGAKTVVTLDGNFINQGTLLAKNSGTLVFRSVNQPTANLGTVRLETGGHARLSGTLDNTGATLTAPIGGSYDLDSGTINNGSIAAGALTFTNNGGLLRNVSLTGDLLLPGAGVYFANGTTFSGTNALLGDYSTLRWQQTGTLDGKSLSMGFNSAIYIVGTNNALTLGPSTTVSGNVRIASDDPGGMLTNQGSVLQDTVTGVGDLHASTFLNTGSIKVSANSTLGIGSYYANYNSRNGPGGSMTADGTYAKLYLSGNFVNQGTLLARNSGQIIFQTGAGSAQTTANLGTIQIANGGHVYLAGTLNNTGATLTAPTGGSFELYGGTISNGTIAPGALAYTSIGGTLNNVALPGDFALPAGAKAYFSGGTTFSGANVTLGDSSYFGWLQSGTLDAKRLNFGATGQFSVGAGSSLTLGSSTIATGSVNLFSFDPGSTIINQGVINHSGVGVIGNLYAQTFVNSGTIVSSGDALFLGQSTLPGSTFTNSPGGVIRTDNGVISLGAPGTSQIVNNGTIDVRSGTLITNNQLTNGGGVISGSGFIRGGLTMAGGTLTPGNSIGTLTIFDGSLNVTGPSVFAVELGGASSDQLVFENPTSAVSIGTGLLTLSLTLLAPPSENTTYNLIRISPGRNGITGTFAGLPSSGNTITAFYADTTYTFGVNYAPNLVSLNFASVPEPSTYALIALGGALLAIVRRRR